MPKIDIEQVLSALVALLMILVCVFSAIFTLKDAIGFKDWTFLVFPPMFIGMALLLILILIERIL